VRVRASERERGGRKGVSEDERGRECVCMRVYARERKRWNEQTEGGGVLHLKEHLVC